MSFEFSLKSRLHSMLVEYGYLSYDEVERLCKEWEYKIDTARRRLEELKDVVPVKSEKQRGGEYTSGWEYVPLVVPEMPKSTKPSRLFTPSQNYTQ